MFVYCCCYCYWRGCWRSQLTRRSCLRPFRGWRRFTKVSCEGGGMFRRGFIGGDRGLSGLRFRFGGSLVGSFRG